MGWRKSIPAVLLLTLAVPPVQGTVVGRAARSGSGAARAVPAGTASSGSLRPRRRDASAGGTELSPQTIALAGEYLRVQAEGAQPHSANLKAWEEYHRWCDATIRRFAERFRSRGVDVDDCTQEVWVELMRALPQFNLNPERGRFSTWLYTLVRSKATDMLRGQLRRPAVSLTESVESGLPSADADPARACQQKEDRRLIRKAMRRLRERASKVSYQVLHLRYFRQMGVREVASAMGLTREQVWVREHRMKRQLRSLFNPGAEAGRVA